MNILVTVDSNYVRPLKVMLTSFFVHHKNENKIYLLYSNVKDSELGELQQLIEKHGSLFFSVRIEESTLSGVPVIRYFTKEMYYRLLAGMVFPKEKRMLYLDPDILIRDSVVPLYETDLEGTVMAGIADVAVNTMLSDHKRELGFQDEEQYLNSGVLLIDLEKLRECFGMEDIKEIVEEKGELLRYPDQDIINLVFRGKMKVMERKYNYSTGYGNGIGMLRYMAGGFVKERRYPVIVHFMGPTKPWHPTYYGKFGREYRRYLKEYPDPDPDSKREWKKRHIAIGKHLFEVMIRKIGGTNHGK